MAAPKPKKINLLIHEGFETSQIGKILAWLLSVGRAIVILVELVVVCAFLSRFWLDRQLTDLIEQNNSKRAEIEASATFEKDFRSLQERLVAIKQIDSLKLVPSSYIKTATNLLPKEVVLTDISFTQDKFLFSGTSTSEGGLAGFIKALEDSDKYKNVTLDSITLDRSSIAFINFIVKADQEIKNTK